MNILVTGGAGFIGSHTCDLLLAQGHSVVALDDFNDSYPARVKRRNIVGALQQPKFRLVEGNYGDRLAVSKLFQAEKFDGVVHLAGSCGSRASMDHSLRFQKNNTGNLISLLQAMREHRPGQGESNFHKIVMLSSSAVYGPDSALPFSEESSCLAPLSQYGVTKRAAEIFLGTYTQLYREPAIRAIVLRGFNVYGPRQRPMMAVSSFIRKTMQGEPSHFYGDGSATRDFVYVTDVAAAIGAALAKFPVSYGVYNIGSGTSVSIAEMHRMVETAMKKSSGFQHLPANPCDLKHTRADITKAKKDLNFSPAMTLQDGIERSVAWMRQSLVSETAFQAQGAAK